MSRNWEYQLDSRINVKEICVDEYVWILMWFSGD
jgi:hypothetical protein